jgi:hypothetical protein
MSLSEDKISNSVYLTTAESSMTRTWTFLATASATGQKSEILTVGTRYVLFR